MKKVFACLSAIALMLVAFGLIAQPAKLSAAEVADGKFIVDPTVEEGDIPLYVMNSIYTTFPNLYDNNALKDENYGLGRDYYWNEIKLVVPEFSNGAATGNRYTVYTQGTYNESKKTAAATKVYLYAKDPNGRIANFTSSNGVIDWGYQEDGVTPSTTTWTHIFGDTSLSGVRYNVTGEDLYYENLYKSNVIANMAEPTEFPKSAGAYTTDPIYLIFDGQGKAVRGAAHDSYFNKENAIAYGYNMLFGKQDGVIVLRNDVTGGEAVNGLGAADADLDREQIAVPNPDDPVLDDFGDPMFDEEGNPLYNDMLVDGENADILYGKRYVWQWYSEEDWANEKVNEVGYLEEGWLADRWDYAYADPNGGYVAIKFVAALGKYAVTTDEENAVHNASVRALLAAGEITQEEHDALLITESIVKDEETGVETVTYPNPYRSPVVLEVTVPKDGIMYRYGYLDYSGAATSPMHLEKYCPLWEGALLSGRHADYQAHARTYNFTATGLTTQNAVVNNESHIVREENGKYVVEIKEGATIVPNEIISVLGMLGGYEISGAPAKEAGSNVAAVISYKQSELSGLEYTMDIDGIPTMRPIQYQYETVKEACAAFMDAIAAHIGLTDYTYENWSGGTYGKFTDENIASFFEANPDWAWFKDFYQTLFDELATAQGFTGYAAWAPNGVRFGIHSLYGEIKWGSWPYSPDFSAEYTTDINDYQPEKSYRYATWDEFVADFLADFGEYVYGDANKFSSAVAYWDESYTADTALQAKQIEFFTTPEWSWLGKELDKGIAAAEWTSYEKTHYYYYRCNVWEYLNKTKRTSWPASCGSFDGMADPAWCGVPLEKDYSKVQFDASSYALFDQFELTLSVVNNATGISDDIAVTFQVVKHATPMIKIDESALSVKFGQTSINLYDAVSAWDCEYKESGNGVYGSDISRQYLEFVYPEGFNPNNLKAGSYQIEAIAKCPSDTGLISKATFNINVLDGSAPEIRVVNGGTVYVVAGAQLKAEDILMFAYDNIDGDYLRDAQVNWNWYIIDTDYDPESYYIGDSFSGKIIVIDSSGNRKEANFSGVVTGNDVVIPKIEIPECPACPDVQAPVEGDGSSEQAGCISFAYVSSFIAAAGLALLILKKRH